MDVAALKPAHLKLLVILERLCRDRSYCWPTNETLARLYGCGPSGGFRRLLKEMEGDGIIFRQMIDPGRAGAGRLGIFLFVRLDHDKPVEEGPPPPPEAVDRLRQTRERFGYGASKGACALPQKGQGGVPQKGQQKSNELERAIRNHNPPVVVEDLPPEKNPEAEAIPPPGAPVRPAAEPSPGAAASVHPAAEGPVAGDLEALVDKATKRFPDASAVKVADAVREHGRDLVEVAVFGLPRLDSWRGVVGSLQNWRRGPDGPTEAEVKAARRSMAASRPTTYHRAPERTAADREAARESAAAIRAMVHGATAG